MTLLRTRKTRVPLWGKIHIPGDKSISHRAVMLSAISNSEVVLDRLLEGDDVIATINAFQAMGVNIHENDRYNWTVHGVGLRGLKKPIETLNMGNSGTSARLIMGILAGQKFSCTITGDESLCKRPMKRITEPLSQMGAQFEFLEKDGCLPIKIIGNPNLKPLKNYEMPVASAQIKSAILLAGLYAKGETSIIEKIPSRDHTENMLKQFEVPINKKDDVITLKPNKLKLNPSLHDEVICIPADPSSAAFFITAALLKEKSEINFDRVSINETRTGFFDVVTKILGCPIEITEENIIEGEPYAQDMIIQYSKIKEGEYIIPAEYAPRMIDEYPILAVLAAGSKATIEMQGIGELRVKESDRIATMEEGLTACGVKVQSGADWLKVYGTGKVKGGALIKTHLDHRIAMSFIILGLIADKPIGIDDISPIHTSFPEFFYWLKILGVYYRV